MTPIHQSRHSPLARWGTLRRAWATSQPARPLLTAGAAYRRSVQSGPVRLSSGQTRSQVGDDSSLLARSLARQSFRLRLSQCARLRTPRQRAVHICIISPPTTSPLSALQVPPRRGLESLGGAASMDAFVGVDGQATVSAVCLLQHLSC